MYYRLLEHVVNTVTSIGTVNILQKKNSETEYSRTAGQAPLTNFALVVGGFMEERPTKMLMESGLAVTILTEDIAKQQSPSNGGRRKCTCANHSLLACGQHGSGCLVASDLTISWELTSAEEQVHIIDLSSQSLQTGG